MKTDGSFCFLLSLSFLLVPGTKESIIKGPFKKTFLDSIMKPLKKTFLDSNSLAVLETYIPEYRMSLKDTSRTLDIILEARRASICCKDVRAREEELSLALRSALYTTIIALSRLQESSSEYRSNMEHRVNSCQDCDILPTHLPCNVTDWQCPSGGCVPYRGLCDGVDDCGDSSDEDTIACDTNPCRHDYLCDADHVCIPKSYQCDSQPDCSDGSDESDCASTTIKQCVEGQFRCEPAGKCVPDIWRCDGIKDCADGNDEASCKSATTPPVCSKEELKCESDGTCLPGGWRCDGDEDCDDGSDEGYCDTTTSTSRPTTSVPITTTPTCSEDQFKCESNGDCLQGNWHCDGDEDCIDGSDERNCDYTTPTCSEDQFKCESDGKCLPGNWRCDAEEDCIDNSDEANCDSTTLTSRTTTPTLRTTNLTPRTTTPTTTTPTCLDAEFQCESDGICVPSIWRCDGDKDCNDGSDEGYCDTTTSIVPPTTIVSITTTPTGCREDQVKCLSTGDCIHANWRCDGVPDCQDASDEEDCNAVKALRDACEGNTCSHGCVDAPWETQDFLCTCPDGMTLLARDRRTCIQEGTKGIKG